MDLGKLFAVIFTLFSMHLCSSEREVKICLVLLVKDESSVIEQCLNSVQDWVDCMCICDVGSKDATLDIIEEFIKEREIPSQFFHHDWRDFGYNRTLLVATAQNMLKEINFSLEDTFLCILDADQILHFDPSFRKNSLTEDLYLIFEKSSSRSFYHYTPHLFRSSLPWESSGVMDETWSCGQPYHTEKLHAVMIEEIGNEEYKENKIKNNVELLLRAIQNDPQNSRYFFFLAQSYRSLKQYEEAIDWFKKRIEGEGDKEEIWFSKYMLGECYEKLDQWEKALFWYLESHQSKPDRAESLRHIATYYRTHGKNDLAYLFAKHGSRISPARDPSFFHTSPLYDYQFDEELSIASYYTPFREEGYKATDDVILRKNVPGYIKEQSCKNLLFYVQNLKNADFKPISIDLPLIHPELDERYHPMNPSLCKTEEGYRLILRAVNYTQCGAKIFNTVDINGIFRTKNFLIEYDSDFKVLSSREILEELSRERIRSFHIEGLEDCRIFKWDQQYWFTCTTFDTNPTGNLQISLCKLEDAPGEETIHVETLIPLNGPDAYRCEKNWLPFVNNNQLFLVYSYAPFIIYKPDLKTGDCNPVVSYEPAHDLSRFRGSAAPIAFDEGYLMLVHEVTLSPDYERIYTHRFLYLDQNFSLISLSKPFTFRHQGVEYCCSMLMDDSKKRLIMPIGVEDREAFLCEISVEDVRSLLCSLPEFYNFPT